MEDRVNGPVRMYCRTDRRSVLPGRRTRFNANGSESGACFSWIEGLVDRGRARCVAEIVVADIHAVLDLIGTVKDGRCLHIGLIYTFSRPVDKHFHCRAALKIV